MTYRPYKPAEMPGLTPYIFVSNPDHSIRFYRQAFGFEVDGELIRQDGKIVHAEMVFLTTRIMLAPQGAWGSPANTPKQDGIVPGASFYVYCEDVDALYERAKQADAQCIRPLEDAFWGDRMCAFADPDGYQWTFACNVSDPKSP